ncbi:MAG: hypothetical protein ABSH52_11360 [Terriglobia bacterium]|jgi:hypothetical protein
MSTHRAGLPMRRRQFLQTAAASCGLSLSAFGQLIPPKAGTVRDKLWLFSNPRNADYEILRKRSVMSPFEAPVYMGIPNIFMVQQYPEKAQESWYKPWEPPFEQYMVPLTMLKRVAWSLTGGGGTTQDWERKQVLSMAHKFPNMVGLYLDDFFHDPKDKEVASLTLEQLRDVQRQIKGPDKKLDLYVTFYTEFLNRPLGEYLKLIDVIALWGEPVKDSANLALLEKLAPNCRKMLGLYTTDHDKNRVPAWIGMPVPTMQRQCEVALQCLRDGRIEGIIIYGGTTLDLGFASVDWTREWIRKVADTKL